MISKKISLVVIFLSAFSLFAEAKPPNIIFMLADDLGYGDLSSYNPNAEGEAPNNTPIRTPTLDSMAKNGVRYTDFHSAAPICSPARRALLTARYPSRLGEWAEAYRGSPDGVVAKNDPTIAMWLKEAGYATAAYGKWNIGESKDVSWPGAHGFDDWLIIDHNTGYFQHKNANKDCEGRPMLFETGGERVTNLEGQYLTDIWTDKAIDFIQETKDQPFFIYLPWSIPHTPLQDPASDPSLAFDAGAKPKTVEGREVYVKMVEYLDSHIARIFKSLKEQGKYDNTLIIFTSDNGGMVSANCWPLKKTKQHLEEGGIRVPFLMQWPSKIKAGTVDQRAAIMMDASVTVLAAADAMKYVPKDRELDGVNLFANKEENREFGWRRRDWGWQGNYLRQEAYRSGDWKLIRSYQYLGNKKWSAEYKEELYKLSDDLGEKNNLKKSMPEKHAEMVKSFDEWKAQVVEQEPSFWPEHADQLGSGAPSQSKEMVIFDFKKGKGNSRLHKAQNKDKILDVKYGASGLSLTLMGGMTGVAPILYKNSAIDTQKYSKALLRMKVITQAGTDLGLAKIVVRHSEWKGKDVPFDFKADGQWHDYEVDLSQSSAWNSYTDQGRIGLLLPVVKTGQVKVEVDYLKLK
ncbi:sulfatase [Lentisphaera araneosa HTCC2155]|uniref:Sulfatase n=1 Tax=Lentisphaera araneosa HTCC2155 TaxID=313628 RepID=A6DNJ0_9BACT|nr:sulfatase-like hydrolase/transferase [Lentisphaera araneosa]EDM26938.1 sulfatase [Lentisphaera araneosa HTCC2155]